MRKSRPGFSLVEAAIVLGVIGLVIGGIWVTASALYRRHQVNQFVQLATLSLKKFDELYKDMPIISTEPTRDLGAVMQKIGLVPPELLRGTSLVTPWGGTIAISIDHYSDINWRFLFYIYAPLPTGVCINILREMSKIADRRPLTVSNNQFMIDPPGTFWYLNSTTVEAQGNAYCNSSLVRILFIFPR